MTASVCIDCGRRIEGARCAKCKRDHERERQERQAYRAGYATLAYRQARQIALARDGDVCVECGAPAEETDHVIPLSVDAGLDLTADQIAERLRSVCRIHHPRGGRRGKARSA